MDAMDEVGLPSFPAWIQSNWLVLFDILACNRLDPFCHGFIEVHFVLAVLSLESLYIDGLITVQGEKM